MYFSFSKLLVVAAAAAGALAQNTTSPLGSLGSRPNERRQLNQEQTQRIIAAASARAAAIGVPQNIAVTDPAGFLLGFLRNDNAFLASIEVGIKKAKTVSLFNGGRTTEVLGTLVQPPDAVIYGIEQTNGGLVAFGGGLPVYINGVFYGAVGVSGGSTAQDIDVATAGIRAVGSTTQSGS